MRWRMPDTTAETAATTPVVNVDVASPPIKRTILPAGPAKTRWRARLPRRPGTGGRMSRAGGPLPTRKGGGRIRPLASSPRRDVAINWRVGSHELDPRHFGD